MTRRNKLLTASLLIFGLLGGCMGTIDDWGDTAPNYQAITPITILKSELPNSVKSSPARELREPGKIYVYAFYLFVVEKYEGVHIINNANPAAPQNIGFITIPGCVDIAVKGRTLYADNAVDLVAVDISDPQSVKVTSREQNVFPPMPFPEGWYTIVRQPDLSKEVVIGWKDTVIN